MSFWLYFQFNVYIISVKILYYLWILYCSLFIYLFIDVCVLVHFVAISMYNLCLCNIHGLCVMSYLVKPECWAPMEHVQMSCKVHKSFPLDNFLQLSLCILLLSCLYLLFRLSFIDFVYMYIYLLIFFAYFSFFILFFIFHFNWFIYLINLVS